MEKQVYLYPKNSDFAPKIIRVRDDGTHSVHDVSSPSSTSPLDVIGSYGNRVCFQNFSENCFVVWNVDSGVEERRILYDPLDANGSISVSGFGHTDEGEIKIVRIARVGLSFMSKTYSGGAGGGAGSRVTGGAVGAGGVWAAWQMSTLGLPFIPDEFQPARFVAATGTIYWHGSVRQVSTIITYNINTDVLGSLPPPAAGVGAKFALGFGFGGELAATVFERSGRGRHGIRLWQLHENNWEVVVNMRLTSNPSPEIKYPYVPLCFLAGTFNNEGLNILFLFDGDTLIKIRLVVEDDSLATELDELHLMDTAVVTTPLPPRHYVHVDPMEFNRLFQRNAANEERQMNRDMNAWTRNFLEQINEFDQI
ncbi:uncharacterized protein LOC112184752 [Rosa chinensis]|nr:uncharacterized protein LOC112184752 [Rosa chinensis]